MVKDKHGMSAIVATVLVILISVAAIAVIWMVVIPMISEGATFDDADTRLDIISSGGYTFYDEAVDKLYVQVKRSSDESDMVGMDIVVTSGGDSETYSYNSSFTPGPNQAISIIIYLGEGSVKPDSIRVVPVINDGGTIKRSSVVSESDVIESSETEAMSSTPFICEEDGECPVDVNFCEGLEWMVNDSFCDVDGSTSCEVVEELSEDCDKGSECKDYFCDDSEGCSETNKDNWISCGSTDEVCINGNCAALGYVWQEHFISTSITSSAGLWDFVMGYEFIPQQDVYLRELCKYTNQLDVVKVVDSGYNLIAQQEVSGANGQWVCSSVVSPVLLLSGQTYFVYTYISSPDDIGYISTEDTGNVEANGVKIIQTVYQSGAVSNDLTAVHNIYARALGMVDIGVSTA